MAKKQQALNGKFEGFIGEFDFEMPELDIDLSAFDIGLPELENSPDVSKPDWAAIKGEYITENISTRKLAEKHGVPYSTLRDRALREQWGKARSDYRSKTVAEAAEASSDAHKSLIEKLYAAADKCTDLILNKLGQIEESGKINVYEIRCITQTVKILVYLFADMDFITQSESDALLEALNSAARETCSGDDSHLLPIE